MERGKSIAKYRKKPDEFQSVTQPLQDTAKLVGQVGVAVVGLGVATTALGAAGGIAGGLLHH